MMAYICHHLDPFQAIVQSYYGNGELKKGEKEMYLGIWLPPLPLFFCCDLMCQWNCLGWLMC